MKGWVSPFLQVVNQNSTFFDIDGTTVFFKDLVLANDLFAPNAKVLIDGKESEVEILLHEYTGNRNIKVLLDRNGKLIKSSWIKPDGNIIEVLRVDSDVYAQVDPATDIDESGFEGYALVRVGCCIVHFLSK